MKTIGELRKIIKDLPDEMEIICVDIDEEPFDVMSITPEDISTFYTWNQHWVVKIKVNTLQGK